MALLNLGASNWKPEKELVNNWDNFKRGLNTLLKETEVRDDELTQADNLMLVGKGVPTRRWGTDLYFLSSATGSVRGLKGLYQSDGTNQLLSITDQGVLTIKSNASYSIVSGASWASGYNMEMAQLNDNMYLVNGQRELVRYSNPTLTSFPTISIPTGIFATGLSGVSGTHTLSYRVSSLSQVGETTASSEYFLANQPQDPTEGSVLVSWSAVSTASGVLTGYNIYGRYAGDERFLAGVGPGSTTWTDDGSTVAAEFVFPKTADTTGGVVAKYVVRFQDRLVYAGISGEPTQVIFSGKAPGNHEKTDWSYGGGFARIEPDAGDDITGLSVFEDRLIVFKERSIWQITLSYVAYGNYQILVPAVKMITQSHGCISHRSIQAVENDVFFLSRKGVYALGYEPNVFNVLRTNEVSARIRPFFDNLTPTQKMNAVAFYKDFRYGITFPGKDKTMVYDRERLAWMGPWTRDGNIFEVYYDSGDNEKLVYGADDSANVYEYSSDYADDDGSSISTQLRTKKDDFKDWSIFKNIEHVFTLFRNVQGTISVDIRLQERDGDITTTKSFSITKASSNAGWGSFGWADFQWADSEEQGGATDINEVYRWTQLNKPARTIQVVVKTENRGDNYELLSIRMKARPMGFGYVPSSEKV